MHPCFSLPIRCRMQHPIRKPEDGTKPVQQRVFKLRTIKNKVSGEGMEADITIFYKEGRPYLDILPELTTVGKAFGVFTDADGDPLGSNGKWYFLGKPLDTGKAKVQAMLKDDPDLRHEVEDAIY